MNIFQKILSWMYVKWVVIPRLENAIDDESTLRIRITKEYDGGSDEEVRMAMREKGFSELH